MNLVMIKLALEALTTPTYPRSGISRDHGVNFEDPQEPTIYHDRNSPANQLRILRISSRARDPAKMITRYLTEISTAFNPFSPRAKTARLFLSFLPGNARATMKITTKVLPKTSREKSFVQVKFKDGKEMRLDSEKLGIKGVMEELDRHSRILARQEELTGN
ncbi:hypothetical protein V494_03956 [Pseudogymnoascus sp. VKM F-4513 (FW-928)]|nr:hypothetical protein V494_03956 [Pseudogymnoascus sp. VKM F-4513 (FW-928)]